MVIVIFSKDDHAFERWLIENPNGYVYSDFGGENEHNQIFHLVGSPLTQQ